MPAAAITTSSTVSPDAVVRSQKIASSKTPNPRGEGRPRSPVASLPAPPGPINVTRRQPSSSPRTSATSSSRPTNDDAGRRSTGRDLYRRIVDDQHLLVPPPQLRWRRDTELVGQQTPVRVVHPQRIRTATHSRIGAASGDAEVVPAVVHATRTPRGLRSPLPLRHRRWTARTALLKPGIAARRGVPLPPVQRRCRLAHARNWNAPTGANMSTMNRDRTGLVLYGCCTEAPERRRPGPRDRARPGISLVAGAGFEPTTFGL